MLNYAVFGQITKEQLDALQKQEDYSTCLQLYLESQLDKNNPEIRKMKTIFYRILAGYMLYDPTLQKFLSYADAAPHTSIFHAISKADPQYESKMSAILIVLYYCIKNRSFNYTLVDNASHTEITQGEQLRVWLESNADSIINNYPKLNVLVSALMVLLYDKVLGATVELVHLGKNIPSSITTYHIGNSISYSDINYRNTTTTQKINALKLIQMDKYRSEFIQRRDFWKQNVPNRAFQANKNTFLFGTYRINEFNQVLSQFDFKLFNIATKYYENYFCHFVNPFTLTLKPLKHILYLLTDNQKKEEELLRKHRNWPLSLLIKSFFKVFLFALPTIFIFILLFYPLGEQTAMMITLFAAIFCFLPPVNRMREKKKRIVYSPLGK